MPDRHIAYVPLDDVAPADRNPKGHDVPAIVESIARFGFTAPVVHDERTDRLVAGHGRLTALRTLRDGNGAVPDGVRLGDDGAWLVPVVRGWASADDAHAQAYLVADNRLGEIGGWDDRALAELLEEALDYSPDLLAVTGYSQDDLDELLASVRNEGGGEVDADAADDAPPAPSDPNAVTTTGDIYRLGRHRLACGDSTDVAVWLALFSDCGPAACMWTDPPYGVNYVGKTGRAMTLSNDNPDGAVALFADVLDACVGHLSPGAAFYVAHPAGPLSLDFGRVLLTPPFKFRQTLVWKKDQFVLGRSDYHYRHEPIYFGYLDNAPGRRGRGGGGWYGDNARDTVFEVPRPRASRHHPTSKPVDLVAAMLRNSTAEGDVVLEPFSGSGSTLMACTTEGRVFRGVELKPGFVDVACARWQAATGNRPILEATGEEVDFAELAAQMAEPEPTDVP